jgi:ABC-type multidrug transport system fused ATPase/permease subunit
LRKEKWPLQGIIEFDKVTMKYRETLEPSIKNLSFKIQSQMKVGIVGRTGAGKSSII